jgi:glycosyltransferase involved in cell wall biosynthesis
VRVLLVSDWMSNRGGAESYILALRDALRDAGDEVQLVSCGTLPALSDNPEFHASGTDNPAKALLQIANPLAARTVRRAVRTFSPDVALVSQFAYHLSPSVFRALDPVPTVVTMMDYKTVCPLGTKLLPKGTLCTEQPGAPCVRNRCIGTLHLMRDRRRYASIRSGLARANVVLCASGNLQSELALAGVEAAVVPLAVRDVDSSFKRNPASVPSFIYCGRLSREKGVAVLLAAFAQVVTEFPAARLRIAGDGPLRSDLEQLALALGVAGQTEFTGWLDAKQVDVEMSNAWALIAPSLWAEPFGLAAIEAIVRGVPVIASDSGGFADNITDGADGLLVPAGDVSSLAQAMRRIAHGDAFPEHRLDSKAVLAAKTNFDFRHHAWRLRAVFSDLLSSSSATTAAFASR